MVMLVENAGGKAISEGQRILNIELRDLHEHVAIILGSAGEVETCAQYLAQT